MRTQFFITYILLIITTSLTAKQEAIGYYQILEVINQFSEKCESERGITLRSYGINYVNKKKPFLGKTDEICIGLSIDKRMDYNEGRKLFYSLYSELLNQFNSIPSMKEYLVNFPISYRDIWFSLAFDYESKGILRNGDLDHICIYKNEIQYSVVENEEEKSSLIQKEVKPDVFMISGISNRTHTYTRCLPEKGNNLDQLPSEEDRKIVRERRKLEQMYE